MKSSQKNHGQEFILMALLRMPVKMEGLEFIFNIQMDKKNKFHLHLDLFQQITKQKQRLLDMQQTQLPPNLKIRITLFFYQMPSQSYRP